jgi:hypothetical protein
VLNEQVVEMMLATFVYPLLLQPLISFSQRLSAKMGAPVFSLAEPHPFGAYSEDFSSAERDLAPVSGPAKAALFTLSSVFQLMTNQPLLRLLFTALFHPFSPNSTGVPTLRSDLEVAKISDTGKSIIRVDGLELASGDDRATYAFGTIPGNRRAAKTSVDLSKTSASGNEACVFVLSPALAEILEFRGEDTDLIARTRQNSYRNGLLKCLDVPPDLSDVRELAISTLDAALTTLNSKFAADMFFGTELNTFDDDIPADERTLDSRNAHATNDRDIGGGGEYDSRHATDGPKGSQVGTDMTNEAVRSLCRCIMTASRYQSSRGVWKVEFDEVAVHVLLACTRYNTRALNIASKSLELIWRQGCSFVALRTNNTHSSMGGMDIPIQGIPSVNDYDYDDQMVGAIANCVFYDKMDSPDLTPVVEEFVQVQGEDFREHERKAYSVAVSSQSTFDTLCNSVGDRLSHAVAASGDPLSEIEEVQLTRSAGLALFQLDALVSLVKDLAATGGTLLKDTSLAGIAISVDGAIVADLKQSRVSNLSKQIYAPISSTITDTFFGEHFEDSVPEVGSHVDLTEGHVLPCVCEAPASIAAVFAADSRVVAEGVVWHSIYLTFSGDFLLFSQPGPNGMSAAESVVIAACPLERLSAQKDESELDMDAPPARRVILHHKWFDERPPSLFLFDALPEHEKLGPFFRMLPFDCTLDVWFEDQTTADQAHQILASNIFKAKSRRGHRIQKFLE